MTILETIQDVLSNSLFENDRRKPDVYLIEQNEHLLNEECESWGHIGLYYDAWGSDDKLIIDWYDYHLVFKAKKNNLRLYKI